MFDVAVVVAAEDISIRFDYSVEGWGEGGETKQFITQTRCSNRAFAAASFRKLNSHLSPPTAVTAALCVCGLLPSVTRSNYRLSSQ